MRSAIAIAALVAAALLFMALASACAGCNQKRSTTTSTQGNSTPRRRIVRFEDAQNRFTVSNPTARVDAGF